MVRSARCPASAVWRAPACRAASPCCDACGAPATQQRPKPCPGGGRRRRHRPAAAARSFPQAPPSPAPGPRRVQERSEKETRRLQHAVTFVTHFLAELTDSSLLGVDVTGRDVVRVAAMPKTAIYQAEVGRWQGGWRARQRQRWPPPPCSARGGAAQGCLAPSSRPARTEPPPPAHRLACAALRAPADYPAILRQGLAFIRRRKKGCLLSWGSETVVLIWKKALPDGTTVWSGPIFLKGKTWGVGFTLGERGSGAGNAVHMRQHGGHPMVARRELATACSKAWRSATARRSSHPSRPAPRLPRPCRQTLAPPPAPAFLRLRPHIMDTPPAPIPPHHNHTHTQASSTCASAWPSSTPRAWVRCCDRTTAPRSAPPSWST